MDLDKFAKSKFTSFCKRKGFQCVWETNSSGPPHNPTFTTRVKLPIPGDFWGQGNARNKKESITRCAMDALMRTEQQGVAIHDRGRPRGLQQRTPVTSYQQRYGNAPRNPVQPQMSSMRAPGPLQTPGSAVAPAQAPAPTPAPTPVPVTSQSSDPVVAKHELAANTEIAKTGLDGGAKASVFDWAQKHNVSTAIDTTMSGPPHAPLFTSTLSIMGHTIQGSGKNKKDSQSHLCMVARSLIEETAGPLRREPTIVKQAAPLGTIEGDCNFMTEGAAHASGYTLEFARGVVDLYTFCVGAVPHVRFMTRGPPHNPVFTATITVGEVAGQGSAKKKAAAEGNAYIDLLMRMEASPATTGAITELKQYIWNNPNLRPEAVLNLDLSQHVMGLVNNALGAYAEQAGRFVTAAHAPEKSLGILSVPCPAFTSDEGLQTSLAALQQRKIDNPGYSTFKQVRADLPIFKSRSVILEAVRNARVVIVSGETGSGKTTQVPQYLLEDMVEQGNVGTVLVTQPRRISAISVAQRVAAERMERIGESVGYQVRLEGVRGSAINFCTVGTFLRRLLTGAHAVEGVRYIVVDEIHERGLNSDFLLIVLKEVLSREDMQHISVVVMSATMDIDRFSKYFWDAPVVSVSGKCFPVEEYYLEDVESIEQQYQGNMHMAQAESMNMSSTYRLGAKRPRSSDGGNDVEVNYDQIAMLIGHLCAGRGPKGSVDGKSILVFLPGWSEIMGVQTSLNFVSSGPPDFKTGLQSGKYRVIPLHSSLTSREQQLVFEAAPGTVKIILSTNIAETSVTIDDVLYVIDSGTVKEKTYFNRGVSDGTMPGRVAALRMVYTSAANAVQRAGRAGRVREGACYRMYTRSDATLRPAHATPEMLRVPLDSLCLTTVSLGVPEPRKFLLKALEAPKVVAVVEALERLLHLSAIVTDGEDHFRLTSLGARLVDLPMEPHIGKMVVTAAAMSCLDPVLTVAACSDMDLFVSSMGVRDAVRSKRYYYSRRSQSDTMASINAYSAWASAKARNPGSEGSFCNENYINRSSINLVSRMKHQFYEILVRGGMVQGMAGPSPCGDSRCFVDQSPSSRLGEHRGVVLGVIASGLYPNVALHKEKKIFTTRTDRQAFFHPSSVNKREREFHNPWFVFEEKVSSTLLYLRGVSAVPAFAFPLLTGGAMTYNETLGLLAIDGWITFRASPAVAGCLNNLREALALTLMHICAVPEDVHARHVFEQLTASVQAVLSTNVEYNRQSSGGAGGRGPKRGRQTYSQPSQGYPQQGYGHYQRY